MVELVQQHPSGGYILDELHVGMAAEKIVVATEDRIRLFAEASDDFNPVHLDEAYALTTPFQGRIAHGMLSAAYISAVLGTKLPGPGAIYLTQSLRFRRPVKIGDPVVTRVTVQALDERRGYVTLATLCQVDGKTVVDGEAVVVAPRRPKDA